MNNVKKILLERKFITAEGIENLRNHKYKGGVYTPIDNIMNSFWIWSLEYFPKTLAPNAITLIGMLTNLSSLLIILSYSFSLSNSVPNWVFLYYAITLFIYQTFDAIDGKQARRLNLSSPLGQLFDHGCDAFQSFVFAFVFLIMLNSGENIYLVKSSLISTIFIFYFANWAEYFTGVLITSSNGVGVTEIQFLIIFFSIITSIFGREIYEVQIFGYEIKFIILTIIMIIGLGSMIPVLIEAYNHSKDKKIFFKMIFPILLIILAIHILISENLFGNMIFGYFAASFAFVTNVIKIIVSSMSKMKFKNLHFESYFLFTISLMIKLLSFNSSIVFVILIISSSILFINLLSLSLSIILQISKELKINILTI